MKQILVEIILTHKILIWAIISVTLTVVHFNFVYLNKCIPCALLFFVVFSPRRWALILEPSPSFQSCRATLTTAVVALGIISPPIKFFFNIKVTSLAIYYEIVWTSLTNKKFIQSWWKYYIIYVSYVQVILNNNLNIFSLVFIWYSIKVSYNQIQYNLFNKKLLHLYR